MCVISVELLGHQSARSPRLVANLYTPSSERPESSWAATGVRNPVNAASLLTMIRDRTHGKVGSSLVFQRSAYRVRVGERRVGQEVLVRRPPRVVPASLGGGCIIPVNALHRGRCWPATPHLNGGRHGHRSIGDARATACGDRSNHFDGARLGIRRCDQAGS